MTYLLDPGLTPTLVFTRTRKSSHPYAVVEQFEEALAEYCGAPYAVAVDCCSNAIMLALAWWRVAHGAKALIPIPRFTYPGVPVAILNAGHRVHIRDWRHDWQTHGWYHLPPTNVTDCARLIYRNMFDDFRIYSACLSFSVEKHLEIGKGGAILTDDEEARDWFIRARHDGRTPGDPTAPIQWPAWHCNMTPDYAARGLWLLAHLPDRPEPLPPTDYPDLADICGEIIAANSSADRRLAVSDE